MDIVAIAAAQGAVRNSTDLAPYRVEAKSLLPQPQRCAFATPAGPVDKTEMQKRQQLMHRGNDARDTQQQLGHPRAP